MHLQNSGYWTKVQIFIRHRGVIGDVNIRIHIAIPHLLWNASTQNEGEVCQFLLIGAKKSVTMATSLH